MFSPFNSQGVPLSKLVSDGTRTMEAAAAVASLTSPGSRSRHYATMGLGVATIGVAVYDLAKRWDRRTMWNLTVPIDSWAYPQLAEWIYKQQRGGSATSLRVTEEGDSIVLLAKIDEDTTFILNGATVTVEKDKGIGASRSLMLEGSKPVEAIILSTASKSAHKFLVTLVSEFSKPPKPNRQLYLQADYDDWLPSRVLPKRPLASVILGDGQSDRVVADIERFLSSREAYDSMGMPWHRGYFFYGAPGTGKTSYATALAAHFDRDVYFLSLSNASKDLSLFNLINAIPRDAILVVEDMDVAGVRSQNRNKDDAGSYPSLAGVLNALDGFTTPTGLITIITANSRESFDEATLRPGRIDIQEEFTYATVSQIHKMVAHFAPQATVELNLPTTLPQTSPAAIMEHFKQHHDDPNSAVAGVNQMLEELSVQA